MNLHLQSHESVITVVRFWDIFFLFFCYTVAEKEAVNVIFNIGENKC